MEINRNKMENVLIIICEVWMGIMVKNMFFLVKGHIFRSKINGVCRPS